ncbi:MAG TPA: hypothetical protein VKL40_17230 [Candidatus Angelobacter sp.]|nr:hypothetical protein [Candidatus Angelobacter sp.]
MRITREKNTAFADQPKPLASGELSNQVKEKPPSKPLESAESRHTLFVPATGKVELVGGTKTAASQGVQIKIANFKPGEHVFPPSVPVKGFETLGNKSPKLAQALHSDGFLPGHLALRPQPHALPKELERAPRFAALGPGIPRKRGFQATTIFPPDNRRVFRDTSYPWSTCGRVDSPLGQGSGTMVGPRHLLTVSHIIQWNSDGTAGWVRFRPAFFDGSAPFGEAWATTTYFKYKVNGPTIDFIEGMYDYVCIVLDHPIGNLTGWMGSRGYTDGWDGGNYWSHVGYPGDLTGGNRPTFQGGIALDGYWWEFDSHEAMSHQADVWPGQSGGSFFGWWSGESFPRVVATQSSQNSSENNASGGQDLVDLIIRARNEHP